MAATIEVIVLLLFIQKYIRITSGASFCHEDRIRQGTHEIDDITDGYQK